ncbi:MAG TPA: DNA repair protein RecO [Candidatus Deferrimicrobiaceae bacterium]
MPAAGARSFHTSRALLVRAVDLGEADRRVTFFTREAGVVVTVGKSAWRSRKRFGGTLQRYVLLDISWSESPGRMPVLSSAALSESFWSVVEEWERVRHADYLLEMAAELFPQAGPKPRAFGILLDGIRSIARGDPPAATARRVEAGFLALGGWGPHLSGCRRCGRADRGRYRFLPSEGGILCEECPPAGGATISLGAVKTWRVLQTGKEGAAVRLRIPGKIVDELHHVMSDYVKYCVGKPMRSLGGNS